MRINLQFFNNKIEEIPTCLGKSIYRINEAPYIIPFPTKYFPNEKHNLDNCETCKKTYRDLIVDMGSYWDKFPNCCADHKKLLQAPWFTKRDYIGFPKMVADKIMFTYHHAINNIDRADWEEEIGNYLAYTVRSFGQFPEGYGGSLRLTQYLNILINLINNYKKHKSNKQNLEKFNRVITMIKRYLKPSVDNPDIDMAALLETYNKWFNTFPFDLPFFAPLKSGFAKTLPIMKSKPTFNPYLNVYSGDLQTLNGLIDFLSETTNHILDSIDTNQLLNDDYITDQTKYNLDLQKQHHGITQKLLLKKHTEGEKQYINTIKEWLENEKSFIKEVLPYLKTIPQDAQKSTAEIPKSFMLIGCENSNDKAADLFDKLQKSGYLHKESRTNFIRAFTGREVSCKIAWHNHFGDLKSLIHYLVKENKLNAVGRYHWQIAANLFSRSGNIDFKSGELKDTKVTNSDSVIQELVKKL